jgi:DNA-binding NarL/FixJ family response regulator
VIFLTVHEDLDYVEAAWSVGALGYVLKSRIATDLLSAVQEAMCDVTTASAADFRATRRSE